MSSTKTISCAVNPENENIFLIGKLHGTINGNKLPCNLQILRHFLFHLKVKKLSIVRSLDITIHRARLFWLQKSIPLMEVRNSVRILRSLFNKWKLLLKSKFKSSPAFEKSRMEFSTKLHQLFDIAQKNALVSMKSEADKEFLLDQRSERNMNIGVWKPKMKTNSKISDKNESECKEIMETTTSEEEEDDDDDVTFETNTSKNKKTKIVSSGLSAALDRSELSDRSAVYVISETAVSLGLDLNDVSVSRSTIRRHRIANRKAVTSQIKSEFSTNFPLTVHFDGKILEDLVGSKLIDRIAVLVTGGGTEQLLGVPKIVGGTGKLIATAVHQSLEEWSLVNQISGVCFDTTSVNTGSKNGACVLLENLIGKRLLWFACRHHVFEIVLAEIFTITMGPSSSPDIQIFKRFRKDWENIDQIKFRTVNDDAQMCSKLSVSTRNRVLNFAKFQIKVKQPREDYLELLNLTIIFLGGEPEKGIHFRAPAGLHRARWMCRLLYGFKLFMMGRTELEDGLFKLTKREENGLRELLLFVIGAGYVEAWATAPESTTAPTNDINFVKRLKQFEKINPKLANGGLKKILNHLWYCSEELIALSFFDSELSSREKRRMVVALREETGDNSAPAKKAKLNQSQIKSSLGPSAFVTSRTINFFKLMNISADFLNKDPDSWPMDESYISVQKQIENLKVVNDVAERGVSLIQELSGKLTKNEDQLQFLLHVVAKHRKNFPDSKKSTIMKGLNQNESFF